MKLSQKYRERMAKSSYVGNKNGALCKKYGFDPDCIRIKLWDDGLIELIPLWTRVSARAKCHPDDKFDINKGLELAFARLAEKLGVLSKWEAKGGEEFFRVTWDDGLIVQDIRVTGNLRDKLDIAIGNCFKTREDATKHTREILERYKKLITYAKELNK